MSKIEKQTRRRKYQRRKTRKSIMNSDISDILNDSDTSDDNLYYDAEYILEQSCIKQSGTGYSISSKSKNPIQRKETEELFNKLIELGWRSEYIQTHFQNINDKLIRNWPDKLLIETLFKKIIQQQGYLGTIRNSLLGIGLRDDVATHLSNILTPLLHSSYTYTQLLDIGIEYLLGDYKPIALPNATYPILPNTVDEWIHVNSKLIYNLPIQAIDKLAKNKVKEAIHTLKNLKNEDNLELYYHTTSWSGSFSIMDSIDRQLGRKCLDFGINPGFYLSSKIEDCIDWAKKRSALFSNEVAIMIFMIPNIIPVDIKIKYLKDTEWIKVTTESRECKKKDKEIKEIRGYDIVIGNMVRNPEDVKKGIDVPKTHTPPKIQLVGRTDNAEEFLHKCLVGCIYFQKFVEQ